MIKHYVSETGDYLGAFGSVERISYTPGNPKKGEPDIVEKRETISPALPAGSREVAIPPAHGYQRWDGKKWIDTAAKVQAEARYTLAATDGRMARVGEDLIAALIAKGVIALGDLPDDAVALLMAREAARDAL